MDELKEIMIFCVDDANVPQMTTRLIRQIVENDSPPVLVTNYEERYPTGRIFLTGNSDWTVDALFATNSYWLQHIIAMRGDREYSEFAVAMFLTHACLPQMRFYTQADEVVAISGKTLLLGKALGAVMKNRKHDPRDLHAVYMEAFRIGTAIYIPTRQPGFKEN